MYQGTLGTETGDSTHDNGTPSTLRLLLRGTGPTFQFRPQDPTRCTRHDFTVLTTLKFPGLSIPLLSEPKN